MKSLLFIDPHFSNRSPTLKSMLREFPACFEDFDEVEVWAIQSDFTDEKLTNDLIKCPFKSWHLSSLYFWIAVHMRYLLRYVILKKNRPTVVQATNYYCYAADLIFCQFSFLRFREIIRSHEKVFRMPLYRWAVFYVHYIQEWILFNISAPKVWWMVSRKMISDCRQYAPDGSSFVLLPNSYDGSRFNLECRMTHRDTMRESMGFTSDRIVFIFVSLGDLERKGFGIAAQVVSKLYASGYPVNLLFVGGPNEEPMNLKTYLEQYRITDLEFLTVKGRVNEIEKYMSAADALLFPSYCEAFALVEIEAAALGLRLYLTPHYGSEMIMREPQNGRFISWNVDESVEIIADEIDRGRLNQSTVNMGESLNRENYLRLLRSSYAEILKNK